MATLQEAHQPFAGAPRSRFNRFFRTIPRLVLWIVSSLLIIIVALIIASFFIDGPLRRSMERGINERLTGYNVRLPHAHFQLFTLAVTLRDLEIVQDSHPSPPVAVIPRLRASMQWGELIHGHLVSDFKIDQPRFNLNLPQLRSEQQDSVKLADRGWQAAALKIYPVKLNLIQIVNGDVVYIDTDSTRPLHLAHVNFSANDVRNVHSNDRVYPSPVHLSADVFEKGHAVVDGKVDFFATPMPAVNLQYRLTDVPLDNLGPIAQRENLTLKGGTIESNGKIEYGPSIKNIDVNNVTVTALNADYHHTPPAALKKVNAAVHEVNNDPTIEIRVDTVDVVNSTFGMMRLVGTHHYRLFLDRANFHLTNYTNHFNEGTARATLHGRFMGSGATNARLVLRPGKESPSFNLDLAIEDASMPAMNDMLRAHGKLDVTKGSFSFYSQVNVANGQMSGYVKPMFKDFQVYSWHQDKHDNVFNQLYEVVASGLLKLFKNHKTDEVATRAVLAGPSATTTADTWELIANAFENAFIKAITPGFDRILGKDRKNRNGN
ncbi:MAG TPA: DUF748 domain-containing protein [Gemmatimonadaceae bacterium]|nr:DUF748 domain-containing protein [Gemmatimonadaceae bacterium]